MNENTRTNLYILNSTHIYIIYNAISKTKQKRSNAYSES